MPWTAAAPCELLKLSDMADALHRGVLLILVRLGVAYKATADGKVVVMKPEDGVASGTVAKFDESVPAVELRGIADIEAMKKTLAPYVEGNQNIFYMIDGRDATAI